MTRCAFAVVAVVVAGCGDNQGGVRAFEAADATRIAAVRPAAPDWAWSRAAATPESSGSPDSNATDPLLVELKRRIAPLAESGDAANSWRVADKLGNLAVGVYGNRADAHQAMSAMNDFSRGWGKRTGTVTKDEPVNDLGDEAWRLWVGGNGTQVTYHWRRENLVIEAHIHCFGTCPSDVDIATRAWADAVDAATQGL